MTQKNPYLINDKLPETATVSYYDVESDQNLTAEEWEKLQSSKSDEINIISEGDGNFISQKEGYGPCSYYGCPYSSPFIVEIFIEGISRKWARKPNIGTFLAGSWEWSPTNSYLYRNDLWLTDIDQARKVISLVLDDDVWTTNLWGGHCVEDNKLCNTALKIIRECIKCHELGFKVEVRETLNSDVSKWSGWGIKVGISLGTSFINPVAVAAIGAGSWVAGGIGQESCDSSRGKAFWGEVGGIGKDTLKGVGQGLFIGGVGAAAGFDNLAYLGSNCSGSFSSALHGMKVAGDIQVWAERGIHFKDAIKHIGHKEGGIEYKSDCEVCRS